MIDNRKVVSREQMEMFAQFWSTFKTVEGQKVLAELDRLFNENTPFIPDSERLTSFHLGQQDVVRFIHRMVFSSRACREADPDELTTYNEGEDI